MKLEINLEDFPSNKIYVRLNKNFMNYLINGTLKKLNFNSLVQLANLINSVALKYNINYKINGGDIKRWSIGSYIDKRTGNIHNKFIPLWIALELIKFTKTSIKYLQAAVSSYRSGGSGNIVFSPKLPIKITPELVSIIIHLMGDGYAGDHTPQYSQKNDNTRQEFIQKIKNCFGPFEEKHCSDKEVRFPKAVTDILIYYFGIRSFMSRDARIPKGIFKLSKQHKLACLTAFIVDEGSIRDTVQLLSANPNLLSDIKKIAEMCDYTCAPIRYEKRAKEFVFGIRNESVTKLLVNINNLQKSYHLCGLAHKYEKLTLLVHIIKNPNSRKPGFAKLKILKALSDRPVTALELANRLRFLYGVTRAHLAKLYESGFVERLPSEKGYLWKIN